MIYHFAGHCLDCERRELRRGTQLVGVEPQVFDLLRYLIEQRQRVVSKDDLLAAVWGGRVVSESALASRISALRHAVGDTGRAQGIIRTFARKGVRFVASVREQARDDSAAGQDDALPAPAQGGPVDAAERRQVTVLSCALDAAVGDWDPDPEDLHAMTESHYRSVQAAVERHGGWVARRSGGEVVACFGYPLAHENDAERALRAALEALAGSVDAGAGDRFSAPRRAGIATGVMVIGGVAHGDAPGEPMAGAAFDIARRLCARAAAGTAVVCPTTRLLVGQLFELDVLADGGDAPAARVLGESQVIDRYSALRQRRWPLVGRDEELALLTKRWRQARSGAGRLVIVSGEPGIGKSRLVAALREAIRDDPHVEVNYHCSPHRAEMALHPVVAHIEQAAGFAATDDGTRRLSKLERMLGGWTDASDRALALLADLLSIPTAGRLAPLSISPQRRKELLFECLAGQLLGQPGGAPVSIVVEDAQWIDPTTLELLDLVVERLGRARALLLLTCRPEFAAPWIGQPHVTALALNRLSRSDTSAFVEQITAGCDLSPDLVEQIVVRSDGVPLYTEELAASVLDRHASGGGVRQHPATSSVVPPSLRASLAARLDRLLDARTLLQTCAALGREFTFQVASVVSGIAERELGAMLEKAVAAGLLHRRGTPPDATYTFKHALVQEAAYETMLRGQRLAVQRRIVEALERGCADLVERHPEMIAHHCEEAALPDRAIDYRIKAARIALDRSAGIEAQSQVERALRLLPAVADESVRRECEGRLQVALGDALIMTHGFAAPEVNAALSKARALLDESRQPIESLGALCGLFNYHLIRSESPICLRLARPLAMGARERAATTVIEYLTGTAHLHLGNFEDSVRHLENALALYDEDEARPVAFIAGYHLRSFTLIWLGLGRLYLGSAEAMATIQAAVADARSRSHPFTLVSALLALARFHNHLGDLEGAIAATEEGMAIAVEQRSPYHVSRASVLRAVNLIEGDRPADGIVAMQAALAAHRRTGANFLSSYNLSCLAQGYAKTGQTELALDVSGQALAEIERCGERWWEAEALRIQAGLLWKVSRPHEARRAYQRSLQCARRQKALLWEQRALRSLHLPAPEHR